MKAIKLLFGFFLVAALATGCVTGNVNDDGTMNASAFGGNSLGELARVQRQTIENDIRKRHADEDAEADRESRRALAKAEVRKAEAEAQMLEAWAGRINPADGSRLKDLLELQKELFAAWVAEPGFTDESLERKQSLWDEIQEVRQLVQDFLHAHDGPPIGYIGSMGGLPLMSGMPMMPGMGIGGPISSGIPRDPTRGQYVNETDGTIRVTVSGTETWVRPQDAVAMLLPPGSYHYTAQKIISTATGTITSPVIGGDFQVDDQWNEGIHQGWELRFHPGAFPRR